MSSKKTLLARKASETGAQTPLPIYQISCILFVQICEALNINVLFPFVAFMVEDMGYTGDALGYHAGLMAAAFCFAQFFTAVPWGLFSDKYGRRPAIIMGTMGSGFGMLIFGMARTFPQAVAARVLSGLLSGNLGVVKSLLTEITDDTNRGAAFSYMSLAWAIGTVIAPLAGGMLCKPTEKYPAAFPPGRGSIFEEFPYLLPCLLCFGWSIFTTLWCAIFMVETRGQKKPAEGEAGDSSKGVEMVKMNQLSSVSSTGSLSSVATVKTGYSMVNNGDAESVDTQDLHQQVNNPLNHHDLESGGMDDSFGAGAHSPGSKYSRMQSQLKSALNDNTIQDAPLSPYSTLSPLTPTGSPNAKVMSPKGSFTISADGDSDDEDSRFEDPELSISNGLAAAAMEADKARLEGSELEEEDDESEDEEDVLCCASKSASASSNSSSLDSSSHNLTDSKGDGAEPKRLSTAMVLRQRVVLLATGNYGMLCAAAILVEETIPLFLKAPINEGGFGFNSMHIGFLLSISGCVMLLFTSLVLPVVSRRSKFWMFRVGTMGSIPIALSMPFIALLNRKVLMDMSPSAHTMILWTLLPLVNIGKSIFSCFAFSAVMIQVNHSVHDEYLGAVNGLGQSMAALARAVGPAIGGALWSLSTRHHFVYLNFIAASLVFLLCLYLNQLMPASLDFKKRVPKNRRGLSVSSSGGDAAPIFH